MRNEVRLLNIGYATEVINGRLNGSAADVENIIGKAKNTTYVKKIGRRGTVSAVCQKWNIQNFMEQVDGLEKSKKVFEKSLDGKKSRISLDPHPAKYFNDDVFGFMMATKKEVLSEEEFNSLSNDIKELYEKKGNGKKVSYEKIGSGTMKRKSRMQMSHLVNVTNNKIEKEFCTASAEEGNTIINIESYSGIMYGISNLNITNVGKFFISDEDVEFRDYNSQVAEKMRVRDLNSEEKFNRINSVLRGLEYLSIEGNQSNYLTDTKPKFIILGEYSWGNNVFQGLINENGVDIEMLRETIEQNEDFRISNIWIGVNRFNNDKFNDMKAKLNILSEEFDFIKVDNVHNSFKAYKEYLKESL